MAFEAYVAHNIPGRLRLKFPGLKRNLTGLERIAQSLQLFPDVLRCDINPITGSILIRYRPAAYVRFVRDFTKFGADKALFKMQTRAPTMVDGKRSPAKSGLQSIRKTAGTFLLFVGVAGVLLPIFPGTPFLLAGLALIGKNHVAVRRGAQLGQSVPSDLR